MYKYTVSWFYFWCELYFNSKEDVVIMDPIDASSTNDTANTSDVTDDSSDDDEIKPNDSVSQAPQLRSPTPGANNNMPPPPPITPSATRTASTPAAMRTPLTLFFFYVWAVCSVQHPAMHRRRRAPNR